VEINTNRFRLKLAAILLSTGFNIRRGLPLFPSNDDKSGSPNDNVEMENPKQQSTTSIKLQSRESVIEMVISYQLSKLLHRIIVIEMIFLGSISKLDVNLPKKRVDGNIVRLHQVD